MPVLLVPVVAAIVAASPCWAPPVDAPVADPFRQPACAYCPGNRGIEYATRDGQVVAAVAAGSVTFAGAVSGTRYVVVDHRDGLRATYGRLAGVSVTRGDRIQAGRAIGTTTTSFYFGLRRGVGPAAVPVDPTPFIGVRRYRPRLVPVDATAAPPAVAGPASCRNHTAAR